MNADPQLIAETLQAGMAHHREGRLAEAAEIYKQVLAIDPANADAMNLLGVLMMTAGQLDVAEELLRKATELHPDFGAAWTNLGNVLQTQGRADDAVAAFGNAIEHMPDSAEVWNNMASALNDAGRPADAVTAAEKALTLDENMVEAASNLGNARKALGDRDGARLAYKAALGAAPDLADAWFNLGVLELEAAALPDAAMALEQAWRLKPQNAEAGTMLAAALLRLDRPEDALAVADEVLRSKPDHAGAWSNRGAALQVLRRLEDAVESFQRAVAMEPEAADAHWNLALALVEQGDWLAAWDEYDWRFDNPAFTTPRRHTDIPLWDGGALEGRTLLVHAEQGMGDTIQFARWLTDVKARSGARLVFECHPPLVRVMERVAGVDAAYPFDGIDEPVDAQVPMLSIAGHLELTPGDLPAAENYMMAEAAPDFGAGFKVGLVWAGSPTHGNDHNRSVPPALLHALLDVDGATYFSLQVGAKGRDVTADLAALDPEERVADLAAGFTDFADTAAALKGLDLLITVDTATAHLAGALGVPVWMLTAHAMSYLWMDTAPETPWYPSMRIFRQAAPGKWDGVVSAVAAALSEEIRRCHGSTT